MAERLSGQCLCGEIRFSCVPEGEEMAVCHCSMCRRWTGGVFMAVTAEDVRIDNGGKPAAYVSSEWGERIFCATCGTSLFWRMRDGSHTAVAAQAFDEPGVFTLTTEIFVDEKPANYDFAGVTAKLTGPEVIAQFTASQEPDHG